MRVGNLFKFVGAMAFALAAATAAHAEDAVVTLPEGQDSAVITVGGVETTVTNGSVIDASQSVGTGGNEIIVTLSDGSAIAVTPGTTFTFSMSASGVPTVNIAGGSARVVSSSGSNFAISTPDGTVVTGTDVAATVNSDGSATVGSNSGAATVTTSTGQTATVAQGTSARSGAGGTVTPSATPLVVGSTTPPTTTAAIPPTQTTPGTTPPTTPSTPTIVAVTVVENALQDAGEGSPQTP